jgi:hypothetical protein
MIVEQADYLVHGVQRGGNHAIINWLLDHFNSSIFYNSCYLDKEKVIVDEENIVIRGREPYEISLASFEDMPDKIKLFKEIFKPKKNIVILRDFYNTYASRFEKKRNEKSEYWIRMRWRFYDDTYLWKNLAGQFYDELNLSINYNRWFKETQYRIETSERIGCAFSDEGLNKVSHFGGGSSFDERKYDGDANKMNVLKRWTNYYNDKEYVEKIFCDDEARYLNRKIFGFSLPRIH